MHPKTKSLILFLFYLVVSIMAGGTYLWHLDIRMDGDLDHCHLQYSNICISRNGIEIHPVLYVFGTLARS